MRKSRRKRKRKMNYPKECKINKEDIMAKKKKIGKPKPPMPKPAY